MNSLSHVFGKLLECCLQRDQANAILCDDNPASPDQEPPGDQSPEEAPLIAPSKDTLHTPPKQQAPIFAAYAPDGTEATVHMTREEQAELMHEYFDVPNDQALLILQLCFSKGLCPVIGGSRVEGRHTISSDLDLAYSPVTEAERKTLKYNSRINHILQKLRDHAESGWVALEHFKIYPGQATKHVELLEAAHEFFDRSGTRHSPGHEGQPYKATGSVLFRPDGSVIFYPPSAAK